MRIVMVKRSGTGLTESASPDRFRALQDVPTVVALAGIGYPSFGA